MATAYGAGAYGANAYGIGNVSGDITVTGVRARATGTGRHGTFNPFRLLGARAAAAVSGRYGNPQNIIAITRTPRFPILIVRIEVTHNPTDPTRSWTDITRYVREVQLTRDGRNNETETTQPGSISIIVDNRDGRFSRDNNNSPYWPWIRTTRWLQVQAVWAGVTYNRWTGLVEFLSQSWPADGADATVEIRGTTALKVLNLFPLDGNSYPSQFSGVRIGTIIGQAGLSGGPEQGAATLPAFAPTLGDGARALAHFQEIEREEHGIVFTESNGDVTFHDRHHRMLYENLRDTLGDTAGTIRYRDVNVDTDDQFLINSVTRNTADGNGVGNATDANSILLHFRRDDTQTLLTNDANEAQAAAEATLIRYRDDPVRISQVEVIGASDTSKWPTILNANNSSLFNVTRHYHNAGTISTPVYIERISETITVDNWRTQWTLSPAVVDQYFGIRAWRVGNATYGKLGTFAIGW